MIIACPHCQTKYQVTYEAIGSAGRKVQCAYCAKAWQQSPPGPQPASPDNQPGVDSMVEDGLDEALTAEEQAVAAELAKRLAAADSQEKSMAAAKLDPALVRSRQRAFSKRQDAISAGQPAAKLRRAVRLGLAALLCTIVAGAYFARVPFVARYPAMAGVYEALGLGVNIVGLDFTDVSSLRTVRAGKDVLVVSAQILGLNPAATRVPDIVITLLDGRDQSLYAWSIAPSVPDLMAGERATFDTQLVMPPVTAERVRLSFAEGSLSPPAPPLTGDATAAQPLETGSAPAPVDAERAAPHDTTTPEHP